MKSKKELQEFLRKEIKKQIVKEDIFDRWVDKIFSRAIQSKVKSDPVLKTLRGDLNKATQKFYDQKIKKYGSYEKLPDWVKQTLKNAGFKT